MNPKSTQIPAQMWPMEVDSVAWNDLEVLRPLQTIRFQDPESWGLIIEWCMEMKRKHVSFHFSHQWGKKMFYYTMGGKRKPHHKPLPCSVDTFDDAENKRAEQEEKTQKFLTEKWIWNYDRS